MSHEITVDQDARLVRVRYTGEITLDERLVIAREVVGVVHATGIHFVLLDFRAAQSLGARPEAIARIVDQCMPSLPPDARLAYLVQYDHQVDGSVEDLARSRGYQVERFQDRAAAVAWLCEARDAAMASAEGDAPHALRLAAELANPARPLTPAQLDALGDLVHALVAAGMEDATVRRVAGRIASVMRPGPSG